MYTVYTLSKQASNYLSEIKIAKFAGLSTIFTDKNFIKNLLPIAVHIARKKIVL